MVRLEGRLSSESLYPLFAPRPADFWVCSSGMQVRVHLKNGAKLYATNLVCE